MRISDFFKKEVINVSDCQCLGSACDLIFDERCGKIQAMVIKGPPKWFHCVGYDSEYVIPWDQIVRIGPDVVLVDVCAKEVLHKL